MAESSGMRLVWGFLSFLNGINCLKYTIFKLNFINENAKGVHESMCSLYKWYINRKKWSLTLNRLARKPAQNYFLRVGDIIHEPLLFPVVNNFVYAVVFVQNRLIGI